MYVIYKKELRRLFGGVLSYAAIGILLLACGFYTVYYNLFLAFTDIAYTLTGSFYALIAAIPLMTCGLYTYERRSGAMPLCYSLGFRPWQIALGKYLAALTVFGLVAAVLALHPLLISCFGKVDLAACYFEWLGYVLMGASLIALCSFVAAFGKRIWIPLGAGVGAVLLLWAGQRFLTVLPVAPWFSFALVVLLLVGVCALLWFAIGARRIALGAAALPVAATAVFIAAPDAYTALVPRLLSNVNPFSRFSGFIYGRFDLEGIVYFISFSAFFVCLTAMLLWSRRDDRI